MDGKWGDYVSEATMLIERAHISIPGWFKRAKKLHTNRKVTPARTRLMKQDQFSLRHTCPTSSISRAQFRPRNSLSQICDCQFIAPCRVADIERRVEREVKFVGVENDRTTKFAMNTFHGSRRRPLTLSSHETMWR